MQCSEQDIKRCSHFRKKYPDLDELPEGKAISWHKIVNKYLPAPSEEKSMQEWIKILKNKSDLEIFKEFGKSEYGNNQPKLTD
ncbi:MAG: hypothetical protein KAW92_10350 [Candidatus Cloacimonetes bacterium]|nr:hypothetical protein [Candidatus Cloacimonadota bacterium]